MAKVGDRARSHEERGRIRASFLLGVIALLLAACGDTGGTELTLVERSVISVASASSTESTGGFRSEAFSDISEDPVSEAAAAKFQEVLSEAADGAGVTATVMTAEGTWSGAVGTADGVRDMLPEDQLAIGSITKSVIAAQVMLLAEAGELALDDPAADHLPADLDFDTNQATIRQLLSMRSGIPDYVDALWNGLSTDRLRSWTTAEVLGLVATSRRPADQTYDYSSTNYVLLGLIIEQARGGPVADVMRDDVLSGEGLERMIYQPEEPPAEPMAMPDGESTDALEMGGGYLPSLAGVTAAGPAGAMAADSASLARWWSRLCGGELVSDSSLTAMMTIQEPEYGLGVMDGTSAHGTGAVGHGGLQVGYTSWAICFADDGFVVVVLTNRENLQIAEIAETLAIAARSD